MTALALAVLLPASGLTVAVATGGEETGSRGGVAAQPAPAAPGVFTPVTGTLGTVKLPNGTTKELTVTVYGGASTRAEADQQLALVQERGDMWPVAGADGKPVLHLPVSPGTMWYSFAFVEGDQRVPWLQAFQPEKENQHPEKENLYLGTGDKGTGVGTVGSKYSAVELDWGKGEKDRPRLVSVPGVDAVKFFVTTMPEGVADFQQPSMTVYNQEGKAFPQS